jgi:hypothetical protein
MAQVRVTLLNGNIVDGSINGNEKPLLYINGDQLTVLDATLMGMFVWPIEDPILDKWRNSFN